jgi:hypothetical protein
LYRVLYIIVCERRPVLWADGAGDEGVVVVVEALSLE